MENKQEGISGKESVKKAASWLYTIIIIVAAVYLIFGTFTIVSFKEQRMLVFTLELSPIRLLSGGEIGGWVFGRRILKTEYGEITLGHWSEIGAWRHNIDYISPMSFRRERAVHNLYIKGVELPKVIEIAFEDFYGQFSWVRMNRHLDGDQKVIISGIPLVVSEILFNDVSNPNNLSFAGGGVFPESGIILADATQISLPFPLIWGLYFHNETETWSLRILPRNVNRHYFLVISPGETEFRRYTSITFGLNWGNFIEGVLAEGEK